MTRDSALRIVVETLTACDLSSFTTEQREKIDDALEVIATMREHSAETQVERRKKNAVTRAKAIIDVMPVVRDTLTTTPNLTAKELFSKCVDRLPAEWTANKIQYLLLNDMADEVGKTEVKGKPNTYFIK